MELQIHLSFFDIFIYILAFGITGIIIFTVYQSIQNPEDTFNYNYHFVNRNFKEESENPVPLNDLFDQLFV